MSATGKPAGAERAFPAGAVILLCLGALGYTLNDTITKFLVPRYSVPTIIFVRGLMALPLIALMAVMIGGDRVRWPKSLWPHAFRGALGLVAASLYIRALETLSVAEATVIVFASPLIVTAGSAFILRERVEWSKWVSVLVSFAGVIVAVQPGAAGFKPGSILILGAAALYATMSLTARWVRPEDSFWSVSFFGSAFAALYVAPLTIGKWRAFHWEDLPLFAGAALCSSLAVGCSTLAYRSAQASDLSPFAYSGLIWSIGATWIVWGAAPQVWTIAGAAIVASSALFQFVALRGQRP